MTSDIRFMNSNAAATKPTCTATLRSTNRERQRKREGGDPNDEAGHGVATEPGQL